MTSYTTNTTQTTSGTYPIYTGKEYTDWSFWANSSYQPIKQTLRAEDIDISFELKDKTRTSLSLQQYMRFAIIHHRLPEDCKDMVELGELLKDMKMIEEL